MMRTYAKHFGFPEKCVNANRVKHLDSAGPDNLPTDPTGHLPNPAGEPDQHHHHEHRGPVRQPDEPRRHQPSPSRRPADLAAGLGAGAHTAFAISARPGRLRRHSARQELLAPDRTGTVATQRQCTRPNQGRWSGQLRLRQSRNRAVPGGPCTASSRVCPMTTSVGSANPSIKMHVA